MNAKDSGWFNPTYEREQVLEQALVGRRIVDVQFDVNCPPLHPDNWESGSPPYGLATLDDGTKVYFAGHDGGCACSAGCYDLTMLNRVDNIITAVHVDANPGSDYSEDYMGGYSIFVLAEHEQLLASFSGTDGNGYYGTGFYIRVIGSGVV